MVPSIEGFQAELEPAAARFTDREVLEQREVPVVASRFTQSIVSERTPSARSGIRKVGSGKPNWVTGCGAGGTTVDVSDWPSHVRPVRSTHAIAAWSAA